MLRAQAIAPDQFRFEYLTVTRGFVPVAKHWVVERPFAWLSAFRRLAVDYERTPASQVAWLLLAHLTMTLNRLHSYNTRWDFNALTIPGATRDTSGLLELSQYSKANGQ